MANDDPGDAERKVAALSLPQAQDVPTAEVQATGAAPQTRSWAKLVLPLGWFVLALTACVFILPFLGIAVSGLDAETKVTALVNWGTHVLAGVLGLASAVLGYYFGTSQDVRS